MKHLYTLVGFLWGLVLGIPVGIGFGAFAAGVSWLYLFGDEPWPESVGWIIPLISLLSGLAVITGCTLGGYVLGERLEGGTTSDISGARKRGYVLGGIAIIIALGMAISVLTSAQKEDLRRQDFSRQKDALAKLVKAVHRISNIVVTGPDANGTFRSTVSLQGARQGSYTLDWIIREQNRRKILMKGARTISFSGGGQTSVFEFSLTELKKNYKKILLHSRGGVLVEEDFTIEVTLHPVLSEKEKNSLSRNEFQNLTLGESPLIQSGTKKFPVRFIIR